MTLHAPCRSIPCHATSSNDVRSHPTHISRRDAVNGGRRLPSSRRGFSRPSASQRRAPTPTDSRRSGREDLLVISHASAAVHAPSRSNIVSAFCRFAIHCVVMFVDIEQPPVRNVDHHALAGRLTANPSLYPPGHRSSRRCSSAFSFASFRFTCIVTCTPPRAPYSASTCNPFTRVVISM